MAERVCVYCSHKFTNWPIRWLSDLVVRFETDTEKQLTTVNDIYYFYTPLLSNAYFAIFTTQSHIILDDFKHNTQNFPQAPRRALPPSSLIILDGDSSFTTIKKHPNNSHPLLQFRQNIPYLIHCYTLTQWFHWIWCYERWESLCGEGWYRNA
jgi:hypothetical protein